LNLVCYLVELRFRKGFSGTRFKLLYDLSEVLLKQLAEGALDRTYQFLSSRLTIGLAVGLSSLLSCLIAFLPNLFDHFCSD
jgi:hypothetical protein